MAIITVRHYRCDQCGKEAVDPLQGWWMLTPLISPRLPDDVTTLQKMDPVPDRHFCSVACLALWAGQQNHRAR